MLETTEICVNCDETHADFDGMICNSCAKSLGMDGVDGRLRHHLLYALLRVYQRDVAQKFSKDEEAYPCVTYVAPTMFFHNARRFSYFDRLYQGIRGKVDGDIVECGVGFAQSLLFLSTLAYDDPIARTVWGFDSFAGPQTITAGDFTGTEFIEPIQLHDVQDAIENATRAMFFYGIPKVWVNSRINLIVGYFKDSFSAFTGSKVAFLHIDANYYDSYAVSLEKFYPLVVDGGIIAFDEYVGSFDSASFPGAKKSIDQFLMDSGEVIRRDTVFGKYYIVKGDENV